MKVNILDGTIENHSFKFSRTNEQTVFILDSNNRILKCIEGNDVHVAAISYNSVCEALIRFMQFMNNVEQLDEVYFIADEVNKKLAIYGYKNA